MFNVLIVVNSEFLCIISECRRLVILSEISIFLNGLYVGHPPVGLTAWWVYPYTFVSCPDSGHRLTASVSTSL